MRISIITAFCIPALALTLASCSSQSKKSDVQYEALLSWEFIQPVQDNRFPSKMQLGQSMRQIQSLRLGAKYVSRTIELDPTYITRCDDPVTICHHGVTNAIVNYTINQDELESNKVIVSGSLNFGLFATVRRESDMGYVEKSIPTGFPLLPEVSVSIPFSGVTGTGEVVTVSGPYNSTFRISINVNNP